MSYKETGKTKMLTGAFFLSLQPVSTMLLGFLIIHSISKNISSEDMGIFSFLNLLYDWYTLIFLLMIHGAITKYAAEYIGRDDKQTVRSLVKTSTSYILIVAPITTFVTFFVTTFIFGILQIEIDLFNILIFCLATGSSITVLLVTALGRGLQKLKTVGSISFFGSILAQTTAWALITKGYGLSGLIFRWLFANIVVIFLIIALDKSLVSLKGDFFPLRKLVKFGFPIFIALMATYACQHAFLRVMMKNSFSLSEVGYFEFGRRLSVLISSLALGYHFALAPYFATDYGYGGEQLVSKNLGWTVKFGSFVFSPTIIGGVAIGKIIFDIAFKEYIPAYPFFVVLTLGLWPVLLLRPFSAALIAIGHPEKFLIARVVSTLLGVPLTFLFVKVSALGITIVWVFMDTAWVFLIVFFSKKYVKVHVDWKKTFMFLISAILILPAVMIEIYFLHDFYALFTVILTILILYIVLVRGFGLIAEREISTALAFMPEGLRKNISRIMSKD